MERRDTYVIAIIGALATVGAAFAQKSFDEPDRDSNNHSSTEASARPTVDEASPPEQPAPSTATESPVEARATRTTKTHAPVAAPVEPEKIDVPEPATTIEPGDLCQHAIDLMKKELGEQFDALSDDEISKIKHDCVTEARQEKKTMSATEYNQQAECVMGAASLADLDKCEE